MTNENKPTRVNWKKKYESLLEEFNSLEEAYKSRCRESSSSYVYKAAVEEAIWEHNFKAAQREAGFND